MKKSEFAKFLRERQLRQADKLSKAIGIPKNMLIMAVKKLSDDDIIDSYRFCSKCNREHWSKKEVNLMIQNSDNPEKVWEVFATHYPSCGHVMGVIL